MIFNNMYEDLVSRIESMLVEKSPVTLGICGYGGSGKSHLADRLADRFGIAGSQVLHMDYLHPHPDLPRDENDIFNDHDWPLIYRVLQDVRSGRRLSYKSMGLWGIRVSLMSRPRAW